ncbi:MAG: hemerythrin domain-containing protein, partial [Kofleriaceae bacterium]|nr:hemerythrin domain-containing protein [Kofleriaceae bacterium]
MAALVAAARRAAAGRSEPEVLQPVYDALAYFSRAAPRHFLDEDGSVFPRLSMRQPTLAPKLAALTAEHPAQVALHHRIAEAATGYALAPAARSGKALLEAALELETLHHRHVAVEDALFTQAAQLLTADDDREISAEMETRRDRDRRDGGGRRGG